MNLSISIHEDEMFLITKYANKHNLTIEDFIKHIISERIKDENDTEYYEDAIKQFKKVGNLKSFNKLLIENT